MPSPFREIGKLAALTLMRQSAPTFAARGRVPRAERGPSGGAQDHGSRPGFRKILQAKLESHSAEFVFPGLGGRAYSREPVGKVFRRAARAGGFGGSSSPHGAGDHGSEVFEQGLHGADRDGARGLED
jgi:hypothetical protein